MKHIDDKEDKSDNKKNIIDNKEDKLKIKSANEIIKII